MKPFHHTSLVLITLVALADTPRAFAQARIASDGVITNAHPEPEYGRPIPFRKVPGTAGTLALEIVGKRLYALEDKGAPKSEWEGLPCHDPASGKVAVVNRIFKNLRLYDFSDKSHPKLLKHLPLNGNAYAPTFWKGRVVLPGGYSGLLLEK